MGKPTILDNSETGNTNSSKRKDLSGVETRVECLCKALRCVHPLLHPHKSQLNFRVTAGLSSSLGELSQNLNHICIENGNERKHAH